MERALLPAMLMRRRAISCLLSFFCLAGAPGAPATLPHAGDIAAGPASLRPLPAFEPNWRRLRARMTREEVLDLLGRPRWTDRSLLFEFWMYEVPSSLASGVVVFENQRVYSWRPPSEAGD